MKATKTKIKNLRLKVIIIVLAVAIVGSFYFNYIFYNQLGIDAKEIDMLNSSIADLAKTIAGLDSQISEKDATIQIFSNKLGLAQNEISVLTPRIENYYVAAVGPNNEGEISPLEVKIINGTGAISVDVNNVDVLEGVQESVRTAASVAESYTGISLGNKDIVISFINTQPYVISVDGPSAGAAMTTTIIAALLNRTMNTKVLMTGTMNSDGTIGQVGDVATKAIAAQSFGANVFLVPAGQSVTVSNLQVKTISTINDAVNRVIE